MGKRIQWTKITPLPSNIPRQLAVEILQSHEEVIKLNPLVTGAQKIDAPRDAPNDEFFAQWYEISEIITWGFGMRKKIAFKGVFHDLPYGMQSHVYAPLGTDMRNKYRIGGNQAGEPREAREMGVDTPLDGLYLREDVDITCNIAFASFIKKEAKDATTKMVDRMVRKAELLDEGKLHAMFEDGKLKTSKPTGLRHGPATNGSVSSNSPPGSPLVVKDALSPRLAHQEYGNYHDVSRSSRHYSSSIHDGADSDRRSSHISAQQYVLMENETSTELPNSEYGSDTAVVQNSSKNGIVFRSELAGDSSFANRDSPSLAPGARMYRAVNPDIEQQTQNQANNAQQSSHRGSSGSYSAQSDLRRASSHSVAGRHNTASQQNIAVGPGQGRLEESDHAAAPTSAVPDFQQFANLSLQNTTSAPAPPPRNPSRLPISSMPSQDARCPVCGMFEGDEAAIIHHVSKAHFA